MNEQEHPKGITAEQCYSMFNMHQTYEDEDNTVRATHRIITASLDNRTVRVWIPLKDGWREDMGYHRVPFADQLRAYFDLPPLPRATIY